MFLLDPTLHIAKGMFTPHKVKPHSNRFQTELDQLKPVSNWTGPTQTGFKLNWTNSNHLQTEQINWHWVWNSGRLTTNHKPQRKNTHFQMSHQIHLNPCVTVTYGEGPWQLFKPPLEVDFHCTSGSFGSMCIWVYINAIKVYGVHFAVENLS